VQWRLDELLNKLEGPEQVLRAVEARVRGHAEPRSDPATDDAAAQDVQMAHRLPLARGSLSKSLASCLFSSILPNASAIQQAQYGYRRENSGQWAAASQRTEDRGQKAVGSPADTIFSIGTAPCIISAMKTLDAPVLDRLLDPIGRILTPEVARGLVNFRFDPKAQARIDKLARKCNEGKLTDAERSEYETYVDAIDFISILQAKARARLKRAKDAG
jgi:hypothetical protein